VLLLSVSETFAAVADAAVAAAEALYEVQGQGVMEL
jgi:hypothetical protein